MKPFRILYFLLTCSILSNGCAPAGSLMHEMEADLKPDFRPLDSSSGTFLFRAKIRLTGNNYTGIFLVKQVQADSTTRIVFLSEIGLNLMDLKYKRDTFELISVQDFLDRPSLIRMLKADFGTLLRDPGDLQGTDIYYKRDEPSEMIQFRYNSRKYSYFHMKGRGVYRIERRSGPFSRTTYSIDRTGPMNILIDHGGLKPDIELIQIPRIDR